MSYHSTSAGVVQGKVWGVTKCLFSNGGSEFHEIKAVKGGYCSKHKHVNKHNRFYVQSGRLEITTWTSTGEDKVIIGPGEFTDVPPGVFHRFEALEDSICLEIYWIDCINGSDIVREDVGGTR
jgi:mannose-6-phosphate isomerase-like protein (cupin superfamily)